MIIQERLTELSDLCALKDVPREASKSSRKLAEHMLNLAPHLLKARPPCPATPRGRHPATGATRFPSHFRTRRHADQARAPPQNFEFLPRCTRNEIVDAVTSESLCRLAFLQELSQVPPPARPPFVPASSPCFHPPPPPSLPTPFPEKSSLSEP